MVEIPAEHRIKDRIWFDLMIVKYLLLYYNNYNYNHFICITIKLLLSQIVTNSSSLLWFPFCVIFIDKSMFFCTSEKRLLTLYVRESEKALIFISFLLLIESRYSIKCPFECNLIKRDQNSGFNRSFGSWKKIGGQKTLRSGRARTSYYLIGDLDPKKTTQFTFSLSGEAKMIPN